MEQTEVGPKQSHFVRRIFHFKAFPPIIARAALLLMVILVATVLVVSTLAARLGDRSLPDPFATFANVFPGQPADTRKLEAQGFSCQESTVPSPADIVQHCLRALPTGSFLQINITIWDGVIQWLDLKMRENDLRVGDLSLQWGSPEVSVVGNWVELSWPKHHVTGLGLSYNRRFTYFQTLAHITFSV